MAHAMHVPHAFQVPALAGHHSRTVVYAVFVFLAGATSIGIIAAVAYWSGHPLVVPSLGPTAFLVFNRSQSNVARPRNIVCGHLIGVLAGYLALVAFGLQHAPSVVDGGLTASRIGAAAFSIALTSAAMILLRAEHAPAGATTLIVSLGFMTTPSSLGLLMAGVLCLAALGIAIDRAAGLRIPFWSGGVPGAAGRSSPTLVSLPMPRGAPPRRDAALRPGRRPSHPGEDGATWVIAPDQGRPVVVGSEQCVVKVEDAYAGSPYSVLEVILDPETAGAMLHAHYDFAETYVVLEGDVVVEAGVGRARAGEGSTICVPAGVAHVLVATGNQCARCLCITARAHHSDREYLP